MTEKTYKSRLGIIFFFLSVLTVEQSWTFTLCSVLYCYSLLSSPDTSPYLPSSDWWFKERDYKSYMEETLLQQCLDFDKQLCSAEHFTVCTHRPQTVVLGAPKWFSLCREYTNLERCYMWQSWWVPDLGFVGKSEIAYCSVTA